MLVCVLFALCGGRIPSVRIKLMSLLINVLSSCAGCDPFVCTLDPLPYNNHLYGCI